MDANARRLDDLWTRHLAGEALDRQDRLALRAAVGSDDVLHRRLLHDLRLDGALRAAAQSEAGGEAFVQRLRALAAAGAASTRPASGVQRQPPPAIRARRRAKSVSWVAAGLVGAAAVVLMLQRAAVVRAPARPADRAASAPGPAPARLDLHVVASIGKVQLYASDGSVRPARVSAVVVPGDWLATVGAGSRVRLEGADGTEIELSGDAVATGLGQTPGQGRLFVARGRMRISLPPDAAVAPPQLVSPHATVTADGCFRVEVSATETRIESHRRRLRVALLTTGRQVDVRAGQYTIARTDQLSPAAPLWGVRRMTGERPLVP